MAVTARSTITGALKLIGVLSPHETMSPEDAADGLLMLNNLVDAWNLDSLFIYTTTEVVATFAGASATIGPAMTINTPRPVRIESAFYRKSGLDFHLDIVNETEYNSIIQKTASGDYPEVMHYDSGSPTGTVYVWPVPASNEYHLTVHSQFTSFANLDDSHTLPQGYARGLMYTLAEDLAPLFQVTEVPKAVIKQGALMRRTIKRANVTVPVLDITLPGNHAQGGRMNILSGY